VDEKMGRPKPDVANILHRYFNLLPKEIELAAPDVVVFFTGPNYDDMLKLTFPGITKNEIPDVRERAMTRLECDRGALPQRTYRLYHPKYLNISRQWDLIERIQDLAKANSAQPI
jgi:hypothetical protein